MNKEIVIHDLVMLRLNSFDLSKISDQELIDIYQEKFESISKSYEEWSLKQPKKPTFEF